MSRFRQLIAGAYSDTLPNAIRVGYKENAVEKAMQLLDALSYFETDLRATPYSVSPDKFAGSVLRVVLNLLQRGNPTRTSVFVEEYLRKAWGGITCSEDKTGAITYQCEEVQQDFAILLGTALYIIAPGVGKEALEQPFWQEAGTTSGERRFLQELLSMENGGYWVQLLGPQVSLESLLGHAHASGRFIKELANVTPSDFREQRVDFAIELPALGGAKSRGLVIEIDDIRHRTDRTQQIHDRRRDAAIRSLESADWSVLRIGTHEWQRLPELLAKHGSSFFNDKYFGFVKSNYEQSIHERPNGAKALALALTPMAVARIQRVLVEAMLQGELDLDSPEWRIGVIERDMRCATLAMDDLRRRIDGLCQLADRPSFLPKINLSVYSDGTFQNGNPEVGSDRIKAASNFEGDMLLDVSVLQRCGLSSPPRSRTRTTVSIRSAHFRKALKKFESAAPIRYAPLFRSDNEMDPIPERIAVLTDLTQDIFRKKGLREGQALIMDRALQRRSVIGLLPTGGGKSLTYQLCALIQPGTTIVIDPIRSLMQDQNEGLVRNGVTGTVFINSSLRTGEEREWASTQLRQGRVLFTFISPERFQIPVFRDMLRGMREQNNVAFAHAVIDEAHCVSEWGHDFRTAYLRLGENVRRFCGTWNGEIIPLFGLTATASFDVLADVRRELNIPEEDVVSHLGSRREELHYSFIRVATSARDLETEWAINKHIGSAKASAVLQLLKNLPADLVSVVPKDQLPAEIDGTDFHVPDSKGRYRHGVLIFCPHKSEKSGLGVRFIAPKLQEAGYAVGTFFGDGEEEEENHSELYQRRFLRNELNVLAATKAFGMGIDKPNIRCTIHLNFPNSIESFVQEAGRAGRDRHGARCYVLLSDRPEHDERVVRFFHERNFSSADHDIRMMTELLTQIGLPGNDKISEVEAEVMEETGELVKCDLWFKEYRRYLYVNRGYRVKYGYVDLDRLEARTDAHTSIPSEVARNVMQTVEAWLKKNTTQGDPAVDFLQKMERSRHIPGIEEILRSRPRGNGPIELVIEFDNDIVDRAAEELSSLVHPQFTAPIVKRAFDKALAAKDLPYWLGRMLGSMEGDNVGYEVAKSLRAYSAQLQMWHDARRSEQDTYKAVYRLSLLGAIKDYEVHYKREGGTMRLHLEPKTDQEYTSAFENYLSRYLAPKRVAEWLAKVPLAGRGSLLQNLSATLVEFVYEFIGKKRERAMLAMREICEEGIDATDPDEIANSINLYFNSKYRDEMLERTDDGLTSNKEVLKHFLEEVGGVSDNLEHLRGSTRRILGDHPDNGALLLLQAYATLLLETKVLNGRLVVRRKSLLQGALSDLQTGLDMYARDGYEPAEVMQVFRSHALEQNEILASVLNDIQNLLRLIKHTNWLTQFNQRYG